MGTAAPHLVRKHFLGQTIIRQQSVICPGLLNRIQVFPLEIFNERNLRDLHIRIFPQNCRNCFQAGQLSRPKAPLPGNEFIAAGGQMPDQYRLQHAILLNGILQILQRLFLEIRTGLITIGLNGRYIQFMSPEDFGRWAPKLIAAGATYIGGCCGTTPEHIQAIAAAARDCPEPVRPERPRRLYLSSRSQTICIDKDLPTLLIGERINPTGRKKLAAEIREGSFLSVKKEALDQVRAGAKLLDVNM